MRIIDADALTKVAGKLWDEMPDGEELSKELMKAINHAPTIEAEPVKHGQWIWMETALGRQYCGCSVCKSPIPSDSVLDFIDETDNAYCYNCGARMDNEGGRKDD